MSITDYLKSYWMDGFQGDISTAKIAITLLMAVAIGVYIFVVYRYKSKSVFYSKDFNTVLAVLPLITAGIVLAMQSSIVISLGMVGALSIVRFRNAIKSTMDLMFLFWSIGVGIIVGAGLFEIVLLMSLAVTILMFALEYVPMKKSPFVLVVNGEDMNVEEVQSIVSQHTSYNRLKSRSKKGSRVDVIWEVKLQESQEEELMQALSGVSAIKNMNLLLHDGEARY